MVSPQGGSMRVAKIDGEPSLGSGCRDLRSRRQHCRSGGQAEPLCAVSAGIILAMTPTSAQNIINAIVLIFYILILPYFILILATTGAALLSRRVRAARRGGGTGGTPCR